MAKFTALFSCVFAAGCPIAPDLVSGASLTNSLRPPLQLKTKSGEIQRPSSPASGPCLPSGPLTDALQSCRNWISFAPPAPFNPNVNAFPTESELRASLLLLHSEGWRGLVTYSMDGTLRHVPRIAKEVGFTKVIAGLFWFDRASFDLERAAALAEVQWVDAYCLGNEGLFPLQLADGTIIPARYSRPDLETEIAALKSNTGRPVATTELFYRYLDDTTLFNIGDWVFPTLHPFNDPNALFQFVPAAVAFTIDHYLALQNAASGHVVIIKETWWPTAGTHSEATEANQTEYFRQLAQSPVKFIWGEAFDQFWKNEGKFQQGPHWGFHTSAGTPKAIIADLRGVYRQPRKTRTQTIITKKPTPGVASTPTAVRSLPDSSRRRSMTSVGDVPRGLALSPAPLLCLARLILSDSCRDELFDQRGWERPIGRKSNGPRRRVVDS